MYSLSGYCLQFLVMSPGTKKLRCSRRPHREEQILWEEWKPLVTFCHWLPVTKLLGPPFSDVMGIPEIHCVLPRLSNHWQHLHSFPEPHCRGHTLSWLMVELAVWNVCKWLLPWPLTSAYHWQLQMAPETQGHRATSVLHALPGEAIWRK